MESHLQRRHGASTLLSKASPGSEQGQVTDHTPSGGVAKLNTALEQELLEINERLKQTEVKLQEEIKARKSVERQVSPLLF